MDTTISFMLATSIFFIIGGDVKWAFYILQKTFCLAFYNFNKLKTLINFVSTYNSGIVNISIATFTILLETLFYYYKPFSTSNINIKKINSRNYELEYNLDGKKYIVLINKKKGPKKIVKIIDEKGNDVMPLLEKYLGSEENFHGNISITPNYFDKKSLTFKYFDDTEKTFLEDDFILI